MFRSKLKKVDVFPLNPFLINTIDYKANGVENQLGAWRYCNSDLIVIIFMALCPLKDSYATIYTII